MATHDQMVAALDAALTGGESDGFCALLAPGAIVWHNNDRKEVDARESVALIGMLGQIVDNLEFERVLLSSTDTGFVLQFAVRGTVASSGNDFEMQTCIVVTTTDEGLISRMDEYVDPTVEAQLT